MTGLESLHSVHRETIGEIDDEVFTDVDDMEAEEEQSIDSGASTKGSDLSGLGVNLQAAHSTVMIKVGSLRHMVLRSS